MTPFSVLEANSAATLMARELTLAADRALWAGDEEDCIAIISQIYGLFDDLELGISPDPRSCLIAADTAAWVGDSARCAQLLSHAVAGC